MNNFNIQSLVVTAVIVMVYAAPVKPPNNTTLLGHIHDDAETLLLKGLTFQALRPPRIDDTTCVKEFFCFAEKSLEKVQSSAKSNLTHLTHHLHKYNKYMNLTCHPTFDGTFPGRDLLNLIMKCAAP